MSALPPGSTIGILGGGQLGRMLAIAAAQLGFDVCIFTDEPDSPASRVAAKTMVGNYLDHAALADFARRVQVVTTEFENIPAETAQALIDAGARVAPTPAALAIAQDRFDEKSYFLSAAIQTPPFKAISSQDDLDAAIAEIGAPAILKTRRLGYDGRGQIRIKTLADAQGAYEKLGAPGILEGFCAFEREVSIIAARGIDGSIAFYDLNENEHSGGILSRTTLPAQVSEPTIVEAQKAARNVLEAFDYVGALTIEFFVMPDGSLIANEMAPRVHNSGHWTIEGALTSQFEQHIRAIAGWPLGPTTRTANIEMLNLIGEDANAWPQLAADPTARLHLYGKRDARAGRKMGHVTKLKLS
ncbi:5-(carboxyamino)imidazole ribonucleotide synthase [Candidatus Viadribacter manganicus]|uniref:N5-carboxyaminoimidazole ribonucleotide synthase n=1 Tax=Candidatus Viadribacter manganicus TaxID=1759059 RepID=A0A1B1AKJ3_9PROT|nr:5-(carboxyamino)imidazole ribonucleotide synthase [Candidatus Viadribacter manganicus]ANP47073.1 phosphoribosylaminoimidazole carboxylase [Candidatus Viadribacter manganicus]